jgi:hypothetical protein
VTGDGPGSETYGPEVLAGDTTVEDFLPGEWTFSAVAKNAAGDAIGAGSCTITVVIGQTTALVANGTNWWTLFHRQ